MGMPSGPTVSVVVTTVGRGEFLGPYCQAVATEEAADRVSFVVIPDRKSPPELYARCEEYRRRGFTIHCPTLEAQDAYLGRLGLGNLVPYDSDNRRNIGFLMALEAGSELLISIDDDNYCRPGEHFFREHAVACAPEAEGISLSSSTGWFNICDLLEIEPANVYPRGFPYKYRHRKAELTQARQRGLVRLNAGLWLLEPDLDAMTWLVSPARASRFKGTSVLLGHGTWSPINTQNTSLHRDLIVSYYYPRMNYPLAGLPIDRFGDILSGYFCQACVRHMGHRVRVGTPMVDHRRNSHNYMRDASLEMGGVWLIEDLTDWLRDVRLQGGTYDECYESLAWELAEVAERFRGFIWTDLTRGYLHQLSHCMRRWVSTCRRWTSCADRSIGGTGRSAARVTPAAAA